METILESGQELAECALEALKDRFSGLTINMAGPIDGSYHIRVDPSVRVEFKVQVREFIAGFKEGWMKKETQIDM